MQKTIWFCTFLLISISSFSQFSVGYRYGIGSHGINLEPDYPFHVPYIRSSQGLIVTYNNENNAGLQLEINYAQKGWREEDTISSEIYFQRDLDYIEVPVYAHFEIGKKMLRPVVIMGPYIAFQINDSYDHNGYDKYFTQDIYANYPQNQDTRTFDYGIKLGGGLRLNIKRFAVFGEVHYDLEMAGGRDVFIDRPDRISVSRLSEISGVFGVMWHIVPQKQKKANEGYTPKEDLYLNDF